jgi:hypothetical protein
MSYSHCQMMALQATTHLTWVHYNMALDNLSWSSHSFLRLVRGIVTVAYMYKTLTILR